MGLRRDRFLLAASRQHCARDSCNGYSIAVPHTRIAEFAERIRRTLKNRRRRSRRDARRSTGNELSRDRALDVATTSTNLSRIRGLRTAGNPLAAAGQLSGRVRPIRQVLKRCRCRLPSLVELAGLDERGNGQNSWERDQAPRSVWPSCRTSSLSILYFSVLNGIPRYSDVP